MRKLPRWWWIVMALWPITGVPVLAYSWVWFDNITPFLRPAPEGWSLSMRLAAFAAVYLPVFLLPFAVAQAHLRNRMSDA
jgi:hypothetical protein